jgi:hypothetical protein
MVSTALTRLCPPYKLRHFLAITALLNKMCRRNTLARPQCISASRYRVLWQRRVWPFLGPRLIRKFLPEFCRDPATRRRRKARQCTIAVA